MRALVPLAAGVVFFAMLSWAAKDPVEVKVAQHRCISPCDQTVLVRIEPNAGNEMLGISLISDGYSTGSGEELRGDDEPLVRQKFYKNLPQGKYTVVASVQRSDKKVFRGVETFCVFGPSEECEESQ